MWKNSSLYNWRWQSWDQWRRQGISEPQQVEASPPSLLMEGDGLLSTEEQRAHELVEGLNSKRCKTDNWVDEDALRSVNESRHKCFKELLVLYQGSVISPHDYVTLGCALTHLFILTRTLPLQLSEALVQQVVVRKVSDDCLLESFLMLMNEKEGGYTWSSSLWK